MKIDNEFISSIKQIMDEKGIPEKDVYFTIEAALAAAYRKEYGKSDDRIEAELDKKTGRVKYYKLYEVVDKTENENNQISLKEARKKRKKAKVGDVIRKKLPEKERFGRIAAQTAKQVVVQRLRESERETIFEEYKNKTGTLVNGVVQQIEGKNVVIDLGKAVGTIFPSEQVPDEKYYIGQRLKVYVKEVEKTSRGPLISLSRSDAGLIKNLFKIEVPEIKEKIVIIENVAREAGKRTKIAVSTKEEGVDPVGSCVGQRGTRVQAVLAEIGGEKIDIVLFDKDPKIFIKNALSPAKIKEVKIVKKGKKVKGSNIASGGEVKVKVYDDQLSLAIGKDGQNVRLASKLTGYSINIEKESEDKKETKKSKAKPETKSQNKAEKTKKNRKK